MKKKTFLFLAAAAVLCVLCTLSVLQVRNVLANHRQNERAETTIKKVTIIKKTSQNNLSNSFFSHSLFFK